MLLHPDVSIMPRYIILIFNRELGNGEVYLLVTPGTAVQTRSPFFQVNRSIVEIMPGRLSKAFREQGLNEESCNLYRVATCVATPKDVLWIYDIYCIYCVYKYIKRIPLNRSTYQPSRSWINLCWLVQNHSSQQMNFCKPKALAKSATTPSTQNERVYSTWRVSGVKFSDEWVFFKWILS